MAYLEESISNTFAKLKVAVKSKTKKCNKTGNFSSIYNDLIKLAKSCKNIKEVNNLRRDLKVALKKLDINIARDKLNAGWKNYKKFLTGPYYNALEEKREKFDKEAAIRIKKKQELDKLTIKTKSNVKDYQKNINNINANFTEDVKTYSVYDIEREITIFKNKWSDSKLTQEINIYFKRILNQSGSTELKKRYLNDLYAKCNHEKESIRYKCNKLMLSDQEHKSDLIEKLNDIHRKAIDIIEEKNRKG